MKALTVRFCSDFCLADSCTDEWQESLFHSHSSFLSSLTSFLSPRSPPSDADIVSMATHPWPTDVGHVFTLSRDRVLKLWKPKLGCVAVKSLDGRTENLSQTPRASPASQLRALLPGDKQTLLRVFSVPSSTEQDQLYVIAFLPTPSSPASGGTFHILDTQGDEFLEIATISCSAGTARCTLQDFMIITPNGTTAKSPVLHTLWDRDGKSVIEWKSIEGFNPSEDTESDEEDEGEEWQSASYAPEPELTPSYLDEALYNLGSMSDTFFEAIMRPGMFSPLTLQTALDQYINACSSLPTATSLQSHIFPPSSASLPGALSSVPAALTQTYSSIAEHIAAVVGCTVTLNTNPTTGEVEHGKYLTALKRDWEGFIARCREIERAARRPLVLGAIASPTASGLFSTGGIVVVVIERERAGILAIEDLAIGVWKSVISSMPFPFSPDASPYPLLQHLHILRNYLYDQSSTTFRELERRLVDIVHQETAFSFKDVLQDLISRIGQEDLHDIVDQEGSEVSELLSSIRRALGISSSEEHNPNLLEDGLRAAFDIIGGFDAEIKLEEEEEDVERLLAPLSPPQAPLRDMPARSSPQNAPSCQWDKALTSAYVITSTNARYELCLSLVMLFYFVFNDEENDTERDERVLIGEGLLAEVFAVLRGVAALRKVVRQAGGRVAKASDPDASPGGREDDDVVSLMRNMNVKAENRSLWASSSSSMSLVRTLLSQEDSLSPALLIQTVDSSGPNLPAAAHRFLDATGLLQSMSPALATSQEVAFCENLRQLGYHDLARELLSWLPRTPGVTYVLARLWLDIGRADDAAYMLEKLGGSFGKDAPS